MSSVTVRARTTAVWEAEQRPSCRSKGHVALLALRPLHSARHCGQRRRCCEHGKPASTGPGGGSAPPRFCHGPETLRPCQRGLRALGPVPSGPPLPSRASVCASLGKGRGPVCGASRARERGGSFSPAHTLLSGWLLLQGNRQVGLGTGPSTLTLWTEAHTSGWRGPGLQGPGRLPPSRVKQGLFPPTTRLPQVSPPPAPDTLVPRPAGGQSRFASAAQPPVPR